ncbi:CbtB-domain containing protein [Aureimonas sp. SK2]|uniref:CbtB domain-containing protein n=1 Tax=Aureimonas sp. SK2 TaxID=3015992 RepID=UPI0024441914|nr:CbtB-domain containing protein [Aureimonas sp. SK2]
MSRSSASALSTPQSTPLSVRLPAMLLSFAAGAFLLWGAGFAGADVLHDTAHDARHAMGLPCH